MSGGLQDSSFSPSPLETCRVFELIVTWFGLPLGDLGTNGLEPGLAKELMNLKRDKNASSS